MSTTTPPRAEGATGGSATASPPAVATPIPPPVVPPERTAFIEEISTAYSDCGRSVVLLSGNRHDLFPTMKGGERFFELERTLYQELSPNFTVIRFDCSTGIGFFDSAEQKALSKAVQDADALVL